MTATPGLGGIKSQEFVGLAKLHQSEVSLATLPPVGAYAFASRAEAEHYAGLMADALRTQQVVWLGQGTTARTFRSGTWFALTNAPTEGERPPAELLLALTRDGAIILNYRL